MRADDATLQDVLEKEIKHFLLCAARWTVRWFNKPKFHILLHLVEHIRRFGPAGLFATEAFESFNAVIRAKSIHSNRQAPSRDIARAFAQGNRIRHLLAGGYFLYTEPRQTTEPATGYGDLGAALPQPRPFSFNIADWRTVGLGPRSLVDRPSTVTTYLGLGGSDDAGQRKCFQCLILHYGYREVAWVRCSSEAIT